MTITEHKHSDYEKFQLYHKLNKEEFKRDKIWTVSRVIVSKKLRGYQRLQFLLDKDKKAITSTSDHDGTRNTRDEDMELRVLAVLAAIGCKSPLSIFDNIFMQRYIHALNPKHRSPHRLERVRIVNVILDYCMAELAKILSERCEALGGAFVSASTDFWSDPHRKEQFGTLVIDLTAYEYEVEGCDEYYFMSRETVERLGDLIVSVSIVVYFIHCFDIS